MTFIEQLLNGENVEWKPLGEVCEYEQPSKYLVSSTMYNDSYPIPVLTAGKSFILGYTNENFGIYKASEHQTIIFDDFTTDIKWVDFDFKAKSSAMKMITSKDENIALLKFIYYWLCTLPQETNIGNHKRNWISKYTKLLIPLPPLSVQHRIVEILDKFTELEAELEAELDCRKRQYEYYRNQLLSFDMLNRGGQRLNDVKIMTLGEIGTFVRGSGLQKKDLTTQGIPAIHYGQIYTYYGTYAKKTKSFVSQEFALKARKAKHGNLIIATTSENDEDVCKAVAWLGDEDIAVSSDACFYAHTMNPKYIAYYFQTELFQSQKRKFITGTKVRRVNAKDLAKIKIPLPPLSVQREIVEILDKFDTLTNSISEGLPKEIELRRKQYEYYRNQLLSFSTVKEKYHG